MIVEHVHEGIGVHFLHVEHALAGPLAGEHHRAADHGGDAGGIGNRLVAGFLVSRFVAADIVDVEGLLTRAVERLAGRDHADIGVALGGFAQRFGFGQHGSEELQRDDFLALVLDRVDPRHADILQHGQVLDVFIAEGHPEARPLHLGVELGEAFELLVIHHVHVLGADRLEVEFDLLAHCRGLDELAVFPVARRRGDFADVDFRIEIGGEGLPVIAAVAIEDVELADRLELVLLQPHGEHAGNARIETRTQQRHQPGILEAVVIGPLPLVFELGLVLRLVIGGVEVIDACFEACIHDRQVLIRQREIDHQARADLPDQIDHRRDFLGVDLVRRHILPGALLHARGDGIALALGAAGEMDIAEDIRVHRHLVDADRADAARTDHQDCGHG